MNRGAVPEENRSDPLDLAGLVFLASATLICACSTLAGWSLASRALPFFTGATVGDGLMYLAIRFARYRVQLVISALLSVAAGMVVSFDLWARWVVGLPVRLPWGMPTVAEKFAFGLVLGFGGLILSSVVLPGLYSPQTWEEAVEQRRALVRGTLVVGGILLAFLVVGLLLFGFLALVAHLVARFAG